MIRTPSGIPNYTDRKLDGLFEEQCMEGVEGRQGNGVQAKLNGTGCGCLSFDSPEFR